MLSTFALLLGDDMRLLRRYGFLAVIYGLLCGGVIALLVPVLTHLLAGQVDAAIAWVLALLAGVAASWLLRRHVERAGVRVGVAVLQSGRHRLGERVARLPVGWFTPQNTARVGHVVTDGMMGIAQLPAHVFTPVICGVVTPLVVIALLFAQRGSLGWIALLSLPVLASVFVLTSWIARRTDAAFQRDFAEASQRLVEFAQAQSVLRAFGGEGGSTRFVEQAVERQGRSGLRLIVLSSLSAVFNVWAVQCVFAALLMVSAAWLGDVLDMGVAAGDLSAVLVSMLLVIRFVEPLLEVAGYAEVLRGAGGQLRAVRALFEVQPLPEGHSAKQPADAGVELRDVHFRYDADAPEVLCGVSLHVKPGSMTALIGASGSGKTTLVRLMARFFDVSAGAVLMGGVDVRDMREEDLAAQVSQIFQDNFLFAGSIADNIRMGRPDASDDAFMQAVQQSGVAEIIGRLPQGLDTPVGEGGARLSGGERQRIAIARALIKDAPILLVDEATASLDAVNQAVIAQTLVRLRGRRTVIVIAHQLSTVAMADQIVVLEAGRVLEQGSPGQLLAGQGRYAEFLNQRAAARGWRIAGATAAGGSL